MTELAPMPHGRLEIMKFYGFSSITSDGVVTAPKNWADGHIVNIPLPLPMPTYDKAHVSHVSIHRVLAASLTAIFAQLHRNHSAVYAELFFSGSFNPRPKRGQPGAFSLHSVGVAIDLNADLFPFRPHHQYVESDMPAWFRFVIDVFHAYGWKWGGTFGDPMHFQYASGY